jgi:hypothetical protein
VAADNKWRQTHVVVFPGCVYAQPVNATIEMMSVIAAGCRRALVRKCDIRSCNRNLTGTLTKKITVERVQTPSHVDVDAVSRNYEGTLYFLGFLAIVIQVLNRHQTVIIISSPSP